MWKKLPLGYYILNEEHRNVVYVTDYIKIWRWLSHKQLLPILKNNNPLLTIDDNLLLQKGLQMLNNPEELKSVEIEPDCAQKILNVDMALKVLNADNSSGYTIKLKLQLSEYHQVMFFMKVTMPLLHVIGDLRASEEELRQLLIKKDKEIEEYKSEGGQIALRSLKTVPYNDEEHMCRHRKFSEYSVILHEDLLKKPEQIPDEEFDEGGTFLSPDEKGDVKTEPPVPVYHEAKCEPESVRSEPHSGKSDLHSVKTEPHSVKSELDDVKTEPASVKIELNSVKSETSTESQTSTTPSPKRKRKKLTY